MTKLPLIENALMAINGASFQSFCNDFFDWIKGYEFLSSSGSVIGKDKTRKGIPDTYIPLENGNYIFIEYTTKERLGKAKSFFEKLSSDIDSCFNKDKSQIESKNIEEVILCFTEKLTPEEHQKLSVKCSKFNAKFKAYGIDQLARQVLLHPSLGKLHLGLTLDTNQLVSPNTFVQEYEKGKIATTLSNKIYGREKEINDAISFLNTNNLLILEGFAGVGKSRLALEVLYEFRTKNKSYIPICVSNKGMLIGEDARTSLIPNKDYIILIDDANRITKHYIQLLGILRDIRKGKVKIIVTVRDYAASIIKDLSKEFNSNSITIRPLMNKQILEIIEGDDFKITNPDYSNRIVEISRGNPRLAIMAAKVALEKNSLLAFNDVPKIYENYFNGIVQDVDALGDKKYLMVLGLISFFKIIGKHQTNIYQILSCFEIKENDFWEKAVNLNELELVDLYENESVKISDQILASYFFYKVFIKDNILDFSKLIENFYDQHKHRFKDQMYPITNTFGLSHISEAIRPSLERLIQTEPYSDTNKILNLYESFWVYDQDKILSILSDTIINTAIDTNEEYYFYEDQTQHDYKSNNDIALNILTKFLEQSNDNLQIALDLSFEYIKRKPNSIPQFVRFCKDSLTYDRHDYKYQFHRQHQFINKLNSLIEQGENDKLFRGLFLNIVNSFLQVDIQKTGGMDRDNTVGIFKFNIPLNDSTKDIRKIIWNRLFDSIEEYRIEVIEIVSNYIYHFNLWANNADVHKATIWKYDMSFLFPFIVNNFDVNKYLDCKLAQDYFKELKRLDLEFNGIITKKFTNEQYKLSQKFNQQIINGIKKTDLLKNPKYRNDETKSVLDLIGEEKYEEIKSYCQNFNLEKYIIVWDNCLEILSVEENNQNWGLKTSLFQALRDLAIKDTELFLSLFDYIINSSGFPKDFSVNYCYNICFNLLKQLDNEHGKFYEIIDETTDQDLLHWKFAYFRSLNKKFITSHHSKILLECFNEIDGSWSFSHLDFLDNYKTIESEEDSIWIESLSILSEKAKQKESRISVEWNFISNNKDRLSDFPELLKKIYFINFENKDHYDLDGKEMTIVCQHYPSFILEFLNKYHKSSFSISSGNIPSHGFRFVWKLDNRIKVLNEIMTFAASKVDAFYDSESFLNDVFSRFDGEKEKQNRLDYIKYNIGEMSKNKEAMKIIFNILSYTFPEERNEMVMHFLCKNPDHEVFRQLRFYTNGVYSGSRIPIIKDRINYLENLLSEIDTLPNSAKYIQHRLIIKQWIKEFDAELKWERKHEFEDFFR